MPFHHTTLDNGLEVVAETNSDVHSVAFGFYVKAGARDETPEVSGVSHFLEHMAFKGTERFSAEDVNRIFDELGADYNAATGEESTIYYAATLPEYLPQTFEIQSSILFPTLRQDDFDIEKKVILEEIGMYADQPSSVAYDNAMQTHFRGHPLGQSVLGTTESVGALTSEQMRQYHREHYLAGNIVLAVAGRTDWDTVLELANRHCAQWPKGRSDRKVMTATPKPSTKYIPKEQCQQEQIIQLAPAPSGSDPLRFAAELMAVVVGDDCNSRLYWDLLDPGLVESAEMGYYEYEETGAYLTFLNGPPEDTKSNLKRIAKIYAEQGLFKAGAAWRTAHGSSGRPRQQLAVPPRISQHRGRRRDRPKNFTGRHSNTARSISPRSDNHDRCRTTFELTVRALFIRCAPSAFSRN